jgi:hypothetical protein
MTHEKALQMCREQSELLDRSGLPYELIIDYFHILYGVCHEVSVQEKLTNEIEYLRTESPTEDMTKLVDYYIKECLNG